MDSFPISSKSSYIAKDLARVALPDPLSWEDSNGYSRETDWWGVSWTRRGALGKNPAEYKDVGLHLITGVWRCWELARKAIGCCSFPVYFILAIWLHRGCFKGEKMRDGVWEETRNLETSLHQAGTLTRSVDWLIVGIQHLSIRAWKVHDSVSNAALSFRSQVFAKGQ